MTPAQPQTITPQNQIAAQQIGAVFNSLHAYLQTLQHAQDDGQLLMSKQLEIAHMHVDDAGHWAIKHVLTFGPPPTKAAAPPDPSANDKQRAPADVAAPLGVVDPPQAPLPTDNAAGKEPV